MKKGNDENLSDKIAVAAVTGAITGFVTTPFDCIKTKVVLDESGLYNGFIDCFTDTLSNQGVNSLFQGGTTRVVWVMIFTAIYLPTYDLIKRLMQKAK